ncbi:DUF2165 family protein [Brucella anthropi]|uniref:DUF2165 family protein n=1 Tax=Brucella anthropi TaxID=529 RepID=UPI002360233C|nr:DUF2165 family protein [Brucella anthropi]
MFEVFIKRIACLLVSLFPALWGMFSFFNNVSDFKETAENAVAPLLSMQDTYGVPGETWRAITASWSSTAGLTAITIIETSAGVLASIGILIMLCSLWGRYETFAKGKVLAMIGALAAIMVWGVGFMVVAGDWFMAWQAKSNPLATQLGAMIYTVPCFLALIVLMLHREEW